MAASLTPTITIIPARYRGASSSDDFNTTNRAAYQDIVTLFSAVAQQSADTTLKNEILTTENLTLAMQLNAISTKLASLQQSFQSLTALNSPGGVGVATMGVSFFDTAVSFGGRAGYPQIPAASRATYAPLYGQIVPAIATAPISKCYITDILTNTIVTPPGVATTATPVVIPTIAPFLVEENDPGQAVDGLSNTCWRRNVYFPASVQVSEVQTTFTATLPQQFINSPTCNYITIDPYPAFGCDITSIVLHGAVTGSDVELLTAPLTASGPVRIFFTDMQVVSVEVTLRANIPIYTLKPGFAAFIMGAVTIDVGWVGFNQSSSTILVPFTLANNYFSTVTGLSNLPSGVTSRIFYEGASGDLVVLNVGDSPLGYSRTLYIELAFMPGQGPIPVVDTLSLSYVPMYVNN